MGELADWELLAPTLTDARRARIEAVLDARSAGLRLVAENLHDPHNLSAILRTADAFGVQHVHLTGAAPAALRPEVALGAQKWLTLHREGPTVPCLERLRAEGFTVAAAALAEGALDPAEWEPQGPVALVLGNERAGLLPATVAAADVVLRIPLAGFAASLNVSVAAALLLYALCGKAALRGRPLPEDERAQLRAEWTVRSVPRSQSLLRHLRAKGSP